MAVVAIYWLLEDKRGRLYLAQYVSKNAGYWILHNKPVSMRGRRLKGKGKRVLGGRETRKLPFPSFSNACHAGYKPVRSEPDGVKRHLQIYKARLTEFIGNNFI